MVDGSRRPRVLRRLLNLVVGWLTGEGERERCGGEFRLARMVGVVTRWIVLAAGFTVWVVGFYRVYWLVGAPLLDGGSWDSQYLDELQRYGWDDDFDALYLALVAVTGGFVGVGRYLWVRHHEEAGDTGFDS